MWVYQVAAVVWSKDEVDDLDLAVTDAIKEKFGGNASRFDLRVSKTQVEEENEVDVGEYLRTVEQ